MKEPIVTIFVTVYNIEEYLDRFFACLKEQTVQNYEVLLIDDGSDDGSLAVCRKYACEDNRIKILTTEHIGISAVRNMLLPQIKTPFATSLDGDDFFDKDYLKHLLDAQEKYNADLVISNVIYLYDNGKEFKRFSPRAEECFCKDEFANVVPALLLEDRLNYLYGKLYRTEYLNDIRVEDDVRQGSDTMINIQYVTKISSIAVIEDYDYSHIFFRTRSVTSYSQDNKFWRLVRIHYFIYDTAKDNGLLNDAMIDAVDQRVLLSGWLCCSNINRSRDSEKNKIERIRKITNSEEYLSAFRRQKERGNTDKLELVIVPGAEEDYIRLVNLVRKENKRNERIRRLRKLCPDFAFRFYHNTKIKLGLLPHEK